MKRPRPVSTISWLQTDTVGQLLASWQLPNVLLSSEMICCKANDFAYLRCDIVFRFVMNANKFAVGSLMVNYEPVPTLSGVARDMFTITQISSYPHCIIDAASSPTIEFRVPFLYKNVAWGMVDEQAVPWAQVNMFVLNGLDSTSGSSDATLRVFVYAENISLDVPVPNKITPYTPHSYIAHMSGEAESAAKTGSISSTLKSVSSLASDVAMLGLGPVSEVGAAVSWVSSIAGKAAEMFGYSKPPNFQLVDPMVQQPAKHMASYDSVDNSVVLGFCAKNSLSIQNDLFSTDKDEMDINYVCSNPAFIETFNWSTSDAVGTVLRSWPVTPGFSGVGTATSNISPTPMAYVASMHAYWRGGIGYKLYVVANSFHSGRLGIVYLPRTTSISSPVSFDDIDAASQVICDVRASTSCVYNVDWTLPEPFLNVRCASRSSVGTGMTYNNLITNSNSLGLVAVFVIAELRAPDQVPQTIPINLFTFGQPNLQFAINELPIYSPVARTIAGPLNPKPISSLSGSAKPEKKKKNSKDEQGYLAHMDDAPLNMNQDPGSAPDGHQPVKGKMVPKNYRVHAATIGDLPNNLRQYTRQFSVAFTDAIPIGNTLELDPTYFGWNISSNRNCRLWRVARLYAYWRGSIRFKIVPQIPAGITYPVIDVVSRLGSGGVTSSPSYSLSTSTTRVGYAHFINVAQTPVIEVQTPFYSSNYLAVLTDADNSARQFVQVTPAYASTEATPYNLYIASGDDFSFGFLKAAPLLQLYS